MLTKTSYSNRNIIYFNTILTLLLSLNVILYLTNKLTLNECIVFFLTQGISIFIIILLNNNYDTAIFSKMSMALNIHIVLYLSLINTILSKQYLGNIFTSVLFNIGFIIFLQSFIMKFNNIDEYMIYSIGIISTLLNLFKAKIELVLIALVATYITIYFINKLPWYITCVIKIIMLCNILMLIKNMPYLFFVVSSVLLSKSYGYLEFPGTAIGHVPSYGFKSFIYTIISFALILMFIRLNLIDLYL